MGAEERENFLAFLFCSLVQCARCRKSLLGAVSASLLAAIADHPLLRTAAGSTPPSARPPPCAPMAAPGPSLPRPMGRLVCAPLTGRNFPDIGVTPEVSFRAVRHTSPLRSGASPPEGAHVHDTSSAEGTGRPGQPPHPAADVPATGAARSTSPPSATGSRGFGPSCRSVAGSRSGSSTKRSPAAARARPLPWRR